MFEFRCLSLSYREMIKVLFSLREATFVLQRKCVELCGIVHSRNVMNVSFDSIVPVLRLKYLQRENIAL